MPNPKEIAVNHQQIYAGSCVSWGVEMLILSCGGKLSTENHYQNKFQPGGCGFGLNIRKEIEAAIGQPVVEHDFKDDFSWFERAALSSFRLKFYPILTFLSYLHYDWATAKMGVMRHTYATYEESEKVNFVTRWFQDTGPTHHTFSDFDQMRASWISCLNKPESLAGPLLHAIMPASIDLSHPNALKLGIHYGPRDVQEPS